MRLRRGVTRAIGAGASLLRGGRVRPGFRALMYHAVGTRVACDRYGISISPRLFEAHMRVLATSEHLSPVAFQPRCAGCSGAARLHVAVTFDDGYRDNLSVAAPILAALGIPFTVFVTSGFVRSGAPEYMTPAELRELAAISGVTIGSHGATHRPLARCDDATLREELRASRCYLEDLLQRPVVALSYPHGSADSRVRDAAAAAGYESGGCSHFGINRADADPLLLSRCEILADDNERVFCQKLSGSWDWYRWRTANLAHSRPPVVRPQPI